MTEPLLSQKDAAARIGVSVVTFWRMVKAGQIPTVLIGKRRLIDPRDLEELIQKAKSRA